MSPNTVLWLESIITMMIGRGLKIVLIPSMMKMLAQSLVWREALGMRLKVKRSRDSCLMISVFLV